MPFDERQPASVSTRDIHEYLNRQSKLCDSRIEDAYMRLSSCFRDERPSSFTPSGPMDRRAMSSSCMSLPSRKKVLIDEIARPSSAQERRPNGSLSAGTPRGILKKAQSPITSTGFERKSSRESPDQWFQRIMHVKKLSPLDLAEVFSYGDARKHPLVPLSHVCEVLFDLDPESLDGVDPVTDEMEDFLYQFATDKGGEIMVNIRETLRALDIWQSRVVSASAQVVPSKLASDPQSRAVLLESKNKKLMEVISSLQDSNLRLSRQLQSAELSRSPKSAVPPAWSPRSRATMKHSSIEVSPVKFKTTTPSSLPESPQKPSKPSTKLEIVNLHEQELIDIASKLQFSGVKGLEELLKEGDAECTGFVNLKQLCYLLADRFQLIISEARLIEVCMGMNFNPSAQLDYKEFVDVLLDILIYALPDIRESAKRNSLIRLDKYLQSGFPPGREGARQLLDALCSKYDMNGDQCISVQELVRVFHKDLVKQHALELPFPLEEHETIQLAHPFLQRNGKYKSSDGFLSYPELLDAIFGPFPQDFNAVDNVKQFKRTLKWEFWHSIYMNLCGGNPRMEEKVLAQLLIILAKIDPNMTYTISTRHFKRIFEQHISSEDMGVIMTVLAVPGEESIGNSSSEMLRYDVLLKLVLGSPEVNDEHFFDLHIRRKLVREQERVQSFTSALMAAHGAAYQLTIQDLYDAFVAQAEAYPLMMSALLFLFASVDPSRDGSTDVKTLKNFLSRRCWRKQPQEDCTVKGTSGQKSSLSDFTSTKKLLAEYCNAYDLQSAVDDLSSDTNGWISAIDLVQQLTKMLRELGVAGVQQEDLVQFVQSMVNNSKLALKHVIKSSTRDAVHCDEFFSNLMDWDALIHSLRLPHSLVEIKKVFERFDWDRVGSIRCEDWNKAYRVISNNQQGLTAWQIRVLQRRFPGNSKERERDLSIDFARLIVFLLAHQQRQEREYLQGRVMEHFHQKFATKHSRMSTAEIERLFRGVDKDNKGYFNVSDLKTYLVKEWSNGSELLNSPDALAFVMHHLVGDNTGNPHIQTPSSSSGSPTVVTLDRFLNLANFCSAAKTTTSKSKSATTRPTSKQLQDAPSRAEKSSTISSLRVLEITILEIASEFTDLKGNILPARAFRYLSYGPTPSASDTTRVSSSSLLRHLKSSSPRNCGLSLSMTNTIQQRVLQASTLDPLTPSKLKQLLQVYHNIDVSTHLISQFFLHIGSSSKYFLDLMHFSQWAAPLSVELQGKIRDVVRKMIVKARGGGGKVDLDRFLAQLQRKLQESPHYMTSTRGSENPPLQFASMSLLLSKLHQLNIPLHKQEFLALLRHFGMEDDLEALDYALFLQRLYELNFSSTICS